MDTLCDIAPTPPLPVLPQIQFWMPVPDNILPLRTNANLCSCQCLMTFPYTHLCFQFFFSPCSLIPLLQMPVFPSLFVSPHTQTQKNHSSLLEHFVLGQFHPSTWYCWALWSCNLRGPPSNFLSGWGDMRHSHQALCERQTQIRSKKAGSQVIVSRQVTLLEPISVSLCTEIEVCR